MKYRADIDGLRAIAVLMVLLFHGGITWFPSGFIGVDIFFVISGYLISTIIFHSLKLGNFKFSEFYARRLWRLQPAIVVLLFATFGIAIVLYLPLDFIDFVKSAKYTALITSNQFFERTTTGYAVPDTGQLLLLHTWSLSIEWQWYLLMPPCLWLMHRYIPSSIIKIIVLVLTVSALIVGVWLTKNYPSKGYYFFSVRIFEFLLGVCATTAIAGQVNLGRYTSSLLGGLSVAAILYCAMLSNILLSYPDYHAVLVCTATAALLYLGGGRQNWATQLLSLKPLVFIGTISYSLYLWHWPVFAVGHYMDIQPTVSSMCISFAIVFLLSLLSYYAVEKRFRKVRLSFKKTALMLFVLPAVLFSGLFTIALKLDGMPIRFGSELAKITRALKSEEAPERQSCLGFNSNGADKKCIVGDTTAQTNSILIGDSFSNQYWGLVDILAKDAEISVLTQGTSSCLALPEIYLFDWWNFKNTVYSECHDNVKKYYDLIKQNHYKFVLIGQMWSNYEADNVINEVGDTRSVELSRARIEKAFEKALNIIIDSGATPIIIKATYVMPTQFMECFYSHIKLRRDLKPGECQSEQWNGDSSDWFSRLFVTLKDKYPSLVIVDPKDVQCVSGSCMTDIGGVPVYRDVGHITDFASFHFGEMYLKKFQNPLILNHH
ncbi:acyltransferase family protein [Pseudomonas sp. AB6]|uniref:acyltransferase family protein n=1 Tax=Pseudomonas sp. AB6 TaxID=3048598 RepID=UPI002AB4895D|nr:acyltransferase family protein [Pseudomonas sp. AB6]MDY7563394.1 acyltransferase family protein [Pseudomonas sp. AB6]MEB0213448.1 acyltransferase family protein [Pseudomonas sp. AB6]